MALSKINRIVREYSHSSAEDGEIFILSIPYESLGMTGGQIIPISGNRNSAYLIECRLIHIGGSTTNDGATFLRVGAGFRESLSYPVITPPANTGAQASAVENFSVATTFNQKQYIRVVGSGAQWNTASDRHEQDLIAPYSAPTGISEGDINIVIVAHGIPNGATLNSKLKLFVDIYGFGDDTL